MEKASRLVQMGKADHDWAVRGEINTDDSPGSRSAEGEEEEEDEDEDEKEETERF